MISHVDNVFIGLTDSSAVDTLDDAQASPGKFIIETKKTDGTHEYLGASPSLDGVDYFRIGESTNSKFVDSDGDTKYIVNWTSWIPKGSIFGPVKTDTYTADTQDTVVIDFSGLSSTLQTLFAVGGKSIVLKIQYLDLPTSYRRWTESYEYVTIATDDSSGIGATIASGFADSINKQYKRARVSADVSEENKLTLTALSYDDDDVNYSLSPAAFVRINVSLYYTDPAAAGYASKNKYYLTGVTITKTPGEIYAASAKLVRDREEDTLGFRGIVNRGPGTFPIIKPDPSVDITAKYDYLTFYYLPKYKTADDWEKKTKQGVEIYTITGTLTLSTLKTALDSWT